MMLVAVAKRNLLPNFSAHHLLRPRCCFSDSSTQSPHFMVDYLITSCGFSPDKAARISKPLAHLKSTQNPHSVLGFLNHQGFSDADIKNLITRYPKILCSNPENTLHPNLRALRNIGLSSSTLTQLLLISPVTLTLQSAVPRIQFWRDFLGPDEANLVKAFKFNRALIGCDIDRVIAPKMSLIQCHGLSTDDIRKIVLTINRFICFSESIMEDLLKRAKELGFQPKTGMFVHALHAMTCVSRDLFQRKMELLKSFEWSEDEFFSALHKFPTILRLSEDNLRATMNFLVGKVRCDPLYIAARPRLLTCSLDKRLRPRHRVLHLLESKGFYGERNSLFSAIMCTDGEFVERYILPHKGGEATAKVSMVASILPSK